MTKTTERLTGADSGFCAACAGLTTTHNEWCLQEQPERPPRTKASLLDEDEVQRLEDEGRQ